MAGGLVYIVSMIRLSLESSLVIRHRDRVHPPRAKAHAKGPYPTTVHLTRSTQHSVLFTC